MGFMKFGREISSLHLELTGKCNLACPSCLRTINPANRSGIASQDLSWDKLLALLTPEELAQLDHVYACGNIGDPIASNHLKEIFGNLKQLNAKNKHSIHTNGALRSSNYWEDLPTYLNPNHVVIFGIDGLKDTNHLYRVNARWDRLMNNVQAFIQSGGIAHWQFIIFEHNKHQVEQARDLSRELGFKHFFTLKSNRHNPNGNKQEIKYVRSASFTPEVSSGSVDCNAIRGKKLYISAQAKLYPCCHIGTASFSIPKDYRDADFDNEQEVNSIPFNPVLDICKFSCTRVAGKRRYDTQFD